MVEVSLEDGRVPIEVAAFLADGAGLVLDRQAAKVGLESV
jgi:hypothetical protein